MGGLLGGPKGYVGPPPPSQIIGGAGGPAPPAPPPPTPLPTPMMVLNGVLTVAAGKTGTTAFCSFSVTLKEIILNVCLIIFFYVSIIIEFEGWNGCLVVTSDKSFKCRPPVF